jgi:hypothetical protein
MIRIRRPTVQWVAKPSAFIAWPCYLGVRRRRAVHLAAAPVDTLARFPVSCRRRGLPTARPGRTADF